MDMSSTINKHLAPCPLKFYSSWFCPYAQCVWIVLEEKGLEYQWIEINPYKEHQSDGNTKVALSLEEKAEKYPEFMLASPRGLIPALNNNGEMVGDSKVIIEYIDEYFEEHKKILPLRAIDRAKTRYWACFAQEKIAANFYKMLLDPNNPTYETVLLQGLNTFAQNMDPIQKDGSAYFFADGFGLADICLLPWYQRIISVLSTYRNFQVSPRDPLTQANFDRIRAWYEFVRSRPSCVATFGDEQALVESYSGYANGSSTSDVTQRYSTITPVTHMKN